MHEFLVNNFANFVDVGLKNVDFVQSLMAFGKLATITTAIPI